jgi:outer membrane scaffolding protein for murein synthesis (MipA/OmpV family)
MKKSCLLLAFGLLVALPASAQDNPILVGAAVRTRPAYDGSASQRTDVVPVLRYYGQRWFARTTQGMLEGGVRTELDRDFFAGAQLAYEAGRDDPHIATGVSAGLHLEWDRRLGRIPLTFLIRARQHLDRDLGGQADLRVTAGVYARGGFLAGVFGQATWGSENAVRSRYGAPDSGLLFTSIGLITSYDVTRHWLLVAGVESRQLRDEAAKSPLAERTSNYYANAGAAYRF